MTTTQITPDNPIGIISIDHLEFTCDSLQSKTRDLFYRMGFQRTYMSSGLEAELFTSGQARFLLIANS